MKVESADALPANGGPKGRFGRKVIAPALIVLVLASATAFVFYDLNDGSFDFRDRDLRLIVTGSMDGEPKDYKIPTIPKDTMVMVRLMSDAEKESIQVGDVIQFQYHGILNHHRVKEVHAEDRYVITQGDNSAGTEKVYFDSIRGEVIGTNHILGEAVSFVKSYVFVLIAFFAVLYIGILLSEEIRKEKEEKQ